jgi:plastocyanin
MKTLFIAALALFTSTSALGAPCAPADFIRLTGPEATIRVEGRGYSPRCASVSSGTAVTIQASARHPLQGIEGAVPNPFLRGNAASSPETQTLNTPGSYGYFCVDHGDAQGNGMSGTVVVE